MALSGTSVSVMFGKLLNGFHQPLQFGGCEVSLRQKFTRSLTLIVLPTLLSISMQGCSDEVQYLPVTGIVTLDGKPLEDAKIAFEPIGDARGDAPGSPSYGRTNSEGRYTLKSYVAGRDGAVEGSHRVRITTMGQSDPTEKQIADAKKRLAQQTQRDPSEITEKEIQGYLSDTIISETVERLPAKYHSQTELKYTVERNHGNKAADFELSSR